MENCGCQATATFMHCEMQLCYNHYRMHMLTNHGKATYLHNSVVWMIWDYELMPVRDDYAPSYNEGAKQANQLYQDWLLEHPEHVPTKQLALQRVPKPEADPLAKRFASLTDAQVEQLQAALAARGA